MAESAVQRRLAAILAADVVGYSRLMGQDEAGTLTAFRKLRAEITDPKIAEHKGRIFKTTGDGFLVEFPSVVNAVACAVDIQERIATRNADSAEERSIVLRIGVNLGDVIIEGDDVFGDGVNVAARLESIAPAGAVAISSAVRDQIGNRLDLQFEDLGELALKNIDKPVRAHAVRSGSRVSSEDRLPAIPNKPSIAVLPFQNMSGDPEQEYFADGIVEDIITALSRFNALFVIARNSSFTYKGRSVDIKQVGRDFGVRYVLEGSVRKSGNRVRITGQLIEALTGTHLWADRFDGLLEDIFDLQDRVTASVVGSIAPKLEQAEIERSKRKPLHSFDAYDHYLRGLSALYQWNAGASSEALSQFYKAIELDPEFATAYGMAAFCHESRMTNGWTTDPAKEIAQIERLAPRAIDLGADDAIALSAAAGSLAFILGDMDAGAELNERALALNPNQAFIWGTSGWIYVQLGEPEKAIEHLARAMRLSPFDPYMFDLQAGTAFAHFFAGRFNEAMAFAETATRSQPSYTPSLRVLAASNALAGRQEAAQRAMARLLERQPNARISNITETISFRRPEDLAVWTEGLRKAGMPE